MTDPTDSQVLFLSAAAQRNPMLLVPSPKTFKGNKATATRVLNSLIKRGLAEERPAKPGEPTWRDDEKSVAIIAQAPGQHRSSAGGAQATPGTDGQWARLTRSTRLAAGMGAGHIQLRRAHILRSVGSKKFAYRNIRFGEPVGEFPNDVSGDGDIQARLQYHNRR